MDGSRGLIKLHRALAIAGLSTVHEARSSGVPWVA